MLAIGVGIYSIIKLKSRYNCVNNIEQLNLDSP